MKKINIADKLADMSVAAAKFIGCESASFLLTKQAKEPKSVKALKKSK